MQRMRGCVHDRYSVHTECTASPAKYNTGLPGNFENENEECNSIFESYTYATGSQSTRAVAFLVNAQNGCTYWRPPLEACARMQLNLSMANVVSRGAGQDSHFLRQTKSEEKYSHEKVLCSEPASFAPSCAPDPCLVTSLLVTEMI